MGECFLKRGCCNSVWWSPGVFDTPPCSWSSWILMPMENTGVSTSVQSEVFWILIRPVTRSNWRVLGFAHQAWLGNTFHLFIRGQPFHGINLFCIMSSQFSASGKIDKLNMPFSGPSHHPPPTTTIPHCVGKQPQIRRHVSMKIRMSISPGGSVRTPPPHPCPI